MTVAIAIITDGRGECFEKMAHSLVEAWGQQPLDKVVVINDSADPLYGRWLSRQYDHWDQVHHVSRQGFGGAIRSAWKEVGGYDFIFHVEDDFTFNEPIDVEGMTHVLTQHPDVVQMALKRQPCNPQEQAAGGFMEQHPEEYTDETTDSWQWCWQRRFFTTNPSFYRGGLTQRGWPEGENSEGRFSLDIINSAPEAKFGYWGWSSEPPRVHHIGTERVGEGY
jgi:hypothetical protein